LEVDGAEGGSLLPPEASLEVRDRRGHDDHLVAEAPAPIERAWNRVRSQHLQVELLDSEGTHRRDHLAHELRRDTRTPGIPPDVQIGEGAERVRSTFGESEAHRIPLVVLGEESRLGSEDLGHFGELLLLIGRPLVNRRRDLVIELAPHLRHGVEVGWACAPDVHPVILAPASRKFADRFWKGANRSPMVRTSVIDRERPSA
jgi:hypothetical protein